MTDNNDAMNKALRQLVAGGSTSSAALTFGDTDTDTDTEAADEGDNAAMNGALRALATGGTYSPTVILGTAKDPEDKAPKSRPARSSAEMSAWLRGEARRQMSSGLEQTIALRDANRD